jgi:hypothetical protein
MMVIKSCKESILSMVGVAASWRPSRQLIGSDAYAGAANNPAKNAANAANRTVTIESPIPNDR